MWIDKPLLVSSGKELQAWRHRLPSVLTDGQLLVWTDGELQVWSD